MPAYGTILDKHDGIANHDILSIIFFLINLRCSLERAFETKCAF